jgi:hypothetical protein
MLAWSIVVTACRRVGGHDHRVSGRSYGVLFGGEGGVVLRQRAPLPMLFCIFSPSLRGGNESPHSGGLAGVCLALLPGRLPPARMGLLSRGGEGIVPSVLWRQGVLTEGR